MRFLNLSCILLKFTFNEFVFSSNKSFMYRNSLLLILPVLIWYYAVSCNQPSTESKNPEQLAELQDDSCNDPDADVNCCFMNMPAELTNSMRLAEKDEKGERLFLSGTVYHADGKTPYESVILYAYQTDHTGHYSKKGDEKGIQ